MNLRREIAQNAFQTLGQRPTLARGRSFRLHQHGSDWVVMERPGGKESPNWELEEDRPLQKKKNVWGKWKVKLMLEIENTLMKY